MIDHGDDAVLHVDYKKHRLAMKVLEGNDFPAASFGMKIDSVSIRISPIHSDRL